MNFEVQLDHALIIEQTNRYEAIAAERQQAHADIIADGELLLLIDDLRALLQRIGAKTEEIANGLRVKIDTTEDMPVVELETDEVSK